MLSLSQHIYLVDGMLQAKVSFTLNSELQIRKSKLMKPTNEHQISYLVMPTLRSLFVRASR